MSDMAPRKAKLTKRLVDSAEPEAAKYLIRDTEMSGFLLQVLPTGTKTYVVQYRTIDRRQRFQKIARADTLTPDEARKRALEILAAVSHGKDPAGAVHERRAAPTMNDAFRRYLDEHVKPHNAARTLVNAKLTIDKHLAPRIGLMKVKEVTKDDVLRIKFALKDRPFAANRAVVTLSSIFNCCEDWGWRNQQTNPAYRIRKNKEPARRRVLNDLEIGQIFAAMREAETIGLPYAPAAEGKKAKHRPRDARSRIAASPLAAIRLLFFTVARASEITELRWSDIDFEQRTIALPITKGEERLPHPAGVEALAILADQPRRAFSQWVFPAEKDATRPMGYSVVQNAWARLMEHTGIDDARLHDIRRTLLTILGRQGKSEIGLRDVARHSSTRMLKVYVQPSLERTRQDMQDGASYIAAAAGLADAGAAKVVPLVKKPRE